MFKFIFPLFVILSFTACSNFKSSEQLAQEGNWTVLGLRDGERGLSSRTLVELKTLARQTGVQDPNVAEYEVGYQEGVDRYCNPDNAYDIGLSGMQYKGICGNQTDGLKFKMEWTRGYNDFLASGQSF